MACKRCGYCCEHIVYVYTNTKDNMDWIAARKFKVVDISDTVIVVHVYHPCANYRKAKGIGICKIQDKKPDACRNYPMSVDFNLYVKQGINPINFLGNKCEFSKLFLESNDGTKED